MTRKSAAVAVVLLIIGWSAALELCNMSQEELRECRPAVTKPNPTDPSEACCEALGHADFSCFCDYKNSPWLGSFGVSPDLALELPAKCHLPNSPTCSD